MKKMVLIFLMFQSLNAFCQKFESVNTDTLYTIYDFPIRNYDNNSNRIKKEKDYISSKKIKTEKIIHTSKSKDNKVFTSNFISHYDSLGHCVNHSWDGANPTLRVFKYDSLDNCTELSVYNQENILVEKQVNEYDKYGNRIYFYSLKDGVEKYDLTNELLTNGDRIIKDKSQDYHYTYIFGSNGKLLEYIITHKKNSPRKVANNISQQIGVQIDTTFIVDNGNYQEIDIHTIVINL